MPLPPGDPRVALPPAVVAAPPALPDATQYTAEERVNIWVYEQANRGGEYHYQGTRNRAVLYSGVVGRRGEWSGPRPPGTYPYQLSRRGSGPPNPGNLVRRQYLRRPPGRPGSGDRRGGAEDRCPAVNAVSRRSRQFRAVAGWAAGVCHRRSLRAGANAEHGHHFQPRPVVAQPVGPGVEVDHPARRGNQSGQFRAGRSWTAMRG